MDKEKRALTITISDLDDLQNVLTAIGNLLKEVLMHYSEEDKDLNDFRTIVLSVATYVGTICQAMGYDKELEDEGE
jgi:hypothetical protein